MPACCFILPITISLDVHSDWSLTDLSYWSLNNLFDWLVSVISICCITLFCTANCIECNLCWLKLFTLLSDPDPTGWPLSLIDSLLSSVLSPIFCICVSILSSLVYPSLYKTYLSLPVLSLYLIDLVLTVPVSCISIQTPGEEFIWKKL